MQLIITNMNQLVDYSITNPAFRLDELLTVYWW